MVVHLTADDQTVEGACEQGCYKMCPPSCLTFMTVILQIPAYTSTDPREREGEKEERKTGVDVASYPPPAPGSEAIEL